MIKQPKVSIIIPTYNRAKIISKAIDSVLLQSVDDIEIIIVDDFSSDYNELKTVIENYSDNKITLLRHNENLNGSTARNTGIKAATGKYLALLDSDDIWLPTKLEECINAEIEEGQVLYSQLKNDDGVFPLTAIRSEEKVGDYLFINKGCMQTSTLFMHLSLAKTILFDESLRRFQDFDFVIRLESGGARFVFLPKILCEMGNDDSGNRISNNISYEPATFWLNKILSELSNKAALAFYSKRIVRLMVLSGNQSRIIKLMPQSINAYMPLTLKVKFILMSKIPSFVYTSTQKTWHLINKIKKSI